MNEQSEGAVLTAYACNGNEEKQGATRSKNKTAKFILAEEKARAKGER